LINNNNNNSINNNNFLKLSPLLLWTTLNELWNMRLIDPPPPLSIRNYYMKSFTLLFS